MLSETSARVINRIKLVFLWLHWTDSTVAISLLLFLQHIILIIISVNQCTKIAFKRYIEDRVNAGG